MRIDWDPGDADKGDFEHHMLKEIYEQPEALEQRHARAGSTMTDATAHFGGLNLDAAAAAPDRPPHHDRVRHQLSRRPGRRIPVRGIRPHSGRGGIRLRISLSQSADRIATRSSWRITQSGETADTLAALRESKRKGHRTLALCNVVGSSIAREADGGVYLHAGPEIGVASTKAFTNQVAVLTMLALYFGRMRHLSQPAGHAHDPGIAGACPSACGETLQVPRPGSPRSPQKYHQVTTCSTWAGNIFSRWRWKGR